MAKRKQTPKPKVAHTPPPAPTRERLKDRIKRQKWALLGFMVSTAIAAGSGWIDYEQLGAARTANDQANYFASRLAQEQRKNKAYETLFAGYQKERNSDHQFYSALVDRLASLEGKSGHLGSGTMRYIPLPMFSSAGQLSRNDRPALSPWRVAASADPCYDGRDLKDALQHNLTVAAREQWPPEPNLEKGDARTVACARSFLAQPHGA